MHWAENNNKLEATFIFADFKLALEFVNNVGEVCEKHNHHADICIQNYNRVFISTTTHDERNIITEIVNNETHQPSDF